MMKRYALVVVACLTLGLAPFLPEPHLLGKLRWIAGGAHGMQWLDWWDTVQHGAPWLVLVGMIIADLKNKFVRSRKRPSA
jgi:hypothetical protein